METGPALSLSYWGLSFQAHVWDGDKNSTTVGLPLTCSKPTGWDGDMKYRSVGSSENASSEPTAWDGDFQSLDFCKNSCLCSKPTGWDGDCGYSSSCASITQRCSKPTMWDGDERLLVESQGPL